MRNVLVICTILALSTSAFAKTDPVKGCFSLIKNIFASPPKKYRIVDTYGNYNEFIKKDSLAYQLGIRIDIYDERARVPTVAAINEFWNLTPDSKLFFVEVKGDARGVIEQFEYHRLISERKIPVTKHQFGRFLSDDGFFHDVFDHAVGMYLIFTSPVGDSVVSLMKDVVAHRDIKEANEIREIVANNLETYSATLSRIDNGYETSILTTEQILMSLQQSVDGLSERWERVRSTNGFKILAGKRAI